MRRVIGCVVALAVFALCLPAFASPPPAPWIAKDIGSPAPGSTDVDDKGVWTIKGDGDDIFGSADNFHFAYQLVKGDASISMRFLSMEVSNESWTKVGLMVRESDASGAPNVNYCMTSGNGLHATVRMDLDEGTASLDRVGPVNELQPNLFLRLQRAGNEVAGFYSVDGRLWTPAKAVEDDADRFKPQTVPAFKEEALIGISVTSHTDGEFGIGKVDQVSLQRGGVSVTALKATGGNKKVLLEWPALASSVGYKYNVYRGASGASFDKLVKLTNEPIGGASYTDAAIDEALVGKPLVYAVTAVGKGVDGNPLEGPAVAVEGTP